MSFFGNASDFPLVPLIDIATLKRGYDLPVNSRIEGGIPIYAANGKNGTHNEAKRKGPGIVTGRSGTIGKVHFVEEDYWPLNTSLYVTNFHGNCPKWIFYMLQSFKLDRFVQGAGVPTLNRNLVHGELIPLPPLAEQKRIAAILDKADSIRRKRQQAIQLADEFLRSVFLEMFGDPVGNPKGWEVCKLGQLALSFQNGTGKNKEFYGRGSKVANIGDLYENISFEPVKYSLLDVSESEINKYKLEKGDLLFVRSSVKRTGVAFCSTYDSEELCLFSSFMIRVKFDLNKVNTKFIATQLRTSSKRIELINASNTATITNINQAGLSGINVILPPIELQNKFVCYVDKISSVLNSVTNSELGIDRCFSSLSQKAFNGEL